MHVLCHGLFLNSSTQIQYSLKLSCFGTKLVATNANMSLGRKDLNWCCGQPLCPEDWHQEPSIFTRPDKAKTLSDGRHQGRLNVNIWKDAYRDYLKKKNLKWRQGSQRTLKATTTGTTNPASCFPHSPGAATVVPECVPARLLQDAPAISSFCAAIFIRLGTMPMLAREELILSCAVGVLSFTICFLWSRGTVLQKTVAVILCRFFLINEWEISIEFLNKLEQCKRWI